MITEKAITTAIASLKGGKRRETALSDPGERGGGRLRFMARQSKSRVTAEWYAVWHRSGKRRSAKIGAYPTVSLATARKTFRETYLPVILRGEDPVGPRATRARGGATVSNLFEAYAESLGARPSATGVRQMLLGKNGAANAIGPNRPAAAVRKQHIIPHLAAIHDRGAITQANYVRNCIHAAFSYGIRSANRYFDRSSAVSWGLEFNPVSVIPSNAAASRPRERALDESELCAFWHWLNANRGRNSAFDATRIIMATGQRACEILQLSEKHFDPSQSLLRWATTKNGRPHCIPLPRQAVEILASLTANEHGLYFPCWQNKSERARSTVVARLVRRYVKETRGEPFEARDLRRTWKTLAGAAGISKDIRDRLQNHAMTDISSRHYDLWDYMPEKRQGMSVWERHLDNILTAPILTAYEQVPSPEFLRKLHGVMSTLLWRGSPQSRHCPDWIGGAVAEASEMDREGEWKSRAWHMALRLAQQGIIVRSFARDDKHRVVPVFSFSPSHVEGGDFPGTVVGPVDVPNRKPWSLETVEAPVADETLRRLESIMSGKIWKAAPQAHRQPFWIGLAVSEAFALDRSDGWRTRAARRAFSLAQQGVLEPAPTIDLAGRGVPGLIFSSKTSRELREFPRIEPLS